MEQALTEVASMRQRAMALGIDALFCGRFLFVVGATLGLGLCLILLPLIVILLIFADADLVALFDELIMDHLALIAGFAVGLLFTFDASRQRSHGKRALHLEICTLDGVRASRNRVLLRFLFTISGLLVLSLLQVPQAYCLTAIAAWCVALVLPLLRPGGQTLHDIVSGTKVFIGTEELADERVEVEFRDSDESIDPDGSARQQGVSGVVGP